MVGTAGADTLNVNDTGWWKDGNSFNESSTPIQAAVSNASSGDTILVDSGTYIENIEVSTSLLNITSANGASVTHVIAADPENPVFDIKSDSVTINGFNISGANGNNGIYASGIYLNNANYCNLTDNTIPDNYFSAIYLSSSSNNNITGNTIANNSMIYGIYLASSENNNLSNNIVFGNNYGIYLANSNNNNLTGNDVSENPGIGIYLQSSSNDNKLIDNIIQDNEGHGILMDDCDNNNITANNISDNGYFDGDEFSGIYLLNSITNNITANTISGNGYHGIKLEGSNSNNLIDNTISGNGYFDVTAYSGIYLLNSITNNITANTISDNDGNGIYMSSPKDTSSDNNFSSNTVYNNSNGIYLQYPQDSTLTDNTVYNNSNGIYLQYPQDSILTGNTVFNNTENGITLYDVDRVYNENNTLIDNTVLNNNNGIDISYVYNTTLIDNIALDNNNGIKIAHSKYNNLTQNNVSNNINNGVYFVSSHENRLVNNTILNNKIGLLLGGQYGSSNNFVGNNNISNNGDNEINSDQGYGCGIYIHESGKNELSGNILSNNDRYGIFLYPGYSHDIYNNTISMNGDGGIYLSSGQYMHNDGNENHIYNNYFNNSNNADLFAGFDNHLNTTNTTGPNIIGGHYIGGNFWVHPNGTGFSVENQDSDGDGFCDSSYEISDGNIDYLPLAGDSTEPTVVPIAPLEKTVGPGDLLELNVSVTDESDISSVVVDVSSINDTVDEIALNNVSGYWNNSIIVDTNTDGVYNLSINATDRWGNSNTSMNLSVVRDSFVTVDAEGKDYTTIQDAIDNTYNGDTIQVFPGTYEENLDVDKGLTIQAASDDPSKTVIEYNGSFLFNEINPNVRSDPVIELHPEEMTQRNVNISGFTIDGNNAAYQGVGTYSDLPLSDITLTDNVIKNISERGIGIFVHGTNAVNLVNNTIVNASSGIVVNREMHSSRQGTISEVNMETGPSINVIGNDMRNIGEFGIQIGSNSLRIGTTGISVYSQSVIEDNYVTLKPDTVSEFTSSFFIPMDRFGIGVSNTNSSIKGNTVIGAGTDVKSVIVGIASINDDYRRLGDASENYISTNIENNRIENTTVGLYTFSPDTRVVDNDVNMTFMGMSSFFSVYNGQISGNTFDNTNMGIMALYMGDTIIQDNVINNGTWTNSSVGIAIEMGFNNAIADNSISLSPNNTMYENSPETTSNLEDGKSIGILLSENQEACIENNHVEKAGIGIEISNSNLFISNIVDSFVMDSSSSQITSMSENFAINFKPSEPIYVNLNNTVTGNTVKDSDMCGLYLSNSNNTTIYNNYFNNYNNTMLDNLSINNTSWNINKTSGNNIVGGSYLGGNFWVHPNGTGFSVDTADSNNDGICDLPYSLTENETDALPLAPAPKAAPEKGSSSGGRAYVGPSMPPEDVKGSDSAIKRILADSNVKYDFPDGEGPVLGISFNAKDDKGTVVAKVQVLKDKPDDVDDPKGNSYQLMSITVGSEGTISDDNADNILIEFKVSKEWIEENNIDPSTIRMTRFHDGEWQDLPSDSVGEDDEYFYFTAETPGFSVFSIVGDEYKKVIEEPLAEEPEGEEVTDEPAAETEAESAQTPGFTAMFAVALIAGAALIMRKD